MVAFRAVVSPGVVSPGVDFLEVDFLEVVSPGVDFLGADVHIGDLFEFARVERPALICLSANSEDTARELRTMQAKLAGMRPRPRFGFGGRIFNADDVLRTSMPGLFLGHNADTAREAVRQLLPI